MNTHTQTVFQVPLKERVHVAALTVRRTTVLVECEALRCKIAAVWHQYCMFIVKKVDLSQTVSL